MSKLLQIAGILFVAIGVALWLMVFFASASLQVRGISADTATLFLVGGVLAAGIGSVISALGISAPAPQVYAKASAPSRSETTVAAATAAATTAAVAEAHEDLSPEVSETIKALDQAKTDLRQAFDEKPAAEEELPPEHVEEALPEPEPEAEPVEEAVEDENQLYVLEERVIRGHPARVLSDGTVEAETAEGWMRFENLEHLDEYLDAMEPSA